MEILESLRSLKWDAVLFIAATYAAAFALGAIATAAILRRARRPRGLYIPTHRTFRG